MAKRGSEIQRGTSPVLIASIEKRIYVIRGQKVMLDYRPGATVPCSDLPAQRASEEKSQAVSARFYVPA
jgi:hypothetical protein